MRVALFFCFPCFSSPSSDHEKKNNKQKKKIKKKYRKKKQKKKLNRCGQANVHACVCM